MANWLLVEMCNRGLIEILLSETNFISVVGVLGYNPGLIREMDFRTALEGDGGFNEVSTVQDNALLADGTVRALAFDFG